MISYVPQLRHSFNVFLPEVLTRVADTRAQHQKEKNQRLVGQRHHCYQMRDIRGHCRFPWVQPLSWLLTTSPPASTSSMCLVPPCLPAVGREVSLFNIGPVLREGYVAVEISIFMDYCSWRQKVFLRRSWRRRLAFLPPCRPPQENQCARPYMQVQVEVSRDLTPVLVLLQRHLPIPFVMSIDAVLGEVPLPCCFYILLLALRSILATPSPTIPVFSAWHCVFRALAFLAIRVKSYIPVLLPVATPCSKSVVSA